MIISLSNFTGDAASIILDFMPYISNVKNLGEALLGFDLVTRKNLTNAERILSLICVIPFANYLKGGKNYKVGHSFLKASERAFVGGKMRNFVKFSKASIRAFAKPNTLQKIAKTGTYVAKGAKSISKIISRSRDGSYIHLVQSAVKQEVQRNEYADNKTRHKKSYENIAVGIKFVLDLQKSGADVPNDRNRKEHRSYQAGRQVEQTAYKDDAHWNDGINAEGYKRIHKKLTCVGRLSSAYKQDEES